jgi:hypothetical protein
MRISVGLVGIMLAKSNGACTSIASPLAHTGGEDISITNVPFPDVVKWETVCNENGVNGCMFKSQSVGNAFGEVRWENGRKHWRQNEGSVDQGSNSAHHMAVLARGV